MNFKSLIKNVALGTLLKHPELGAEGSSEDTQETFSNTSEDTTVTVGPEAHHHEIVKEPSANVHIHENIKIIVQNIIDTAVDISEGVDDDKSSKGSDVILSGLKLVPPSSLLSPAKGLLQQALESTQEESGSFVQKNSLLASLLVSNKSTENTPGVAREYDVPNHRSASSHLTINVPKPVSKVNNMINIRTLGGSDQRNSDEAAQLFYSQVINHQGINKADGSNSETKQHFKTPLLLTQGRPKPKGLPQARIAPSTPPLCSPTGSESTDQGSLTQLPRSQCQPKHDQAKLLGVFNTTVSTPSLSSKPYIAVVFDKGTLFVPNTGNSGSQWRTKSAKKVGHMFDLKLFRTNPARASYDTVELNLNFAIFTVEKPGSAAKVISDVEFGSCFYLQATAVVRVDTFFIHDKGQRWIMSAELVSDLCESTNSDILCFLQRSSIIDQADETAGDPIAEEELTPPTLPVTHPPVILVPKLSVSARSPLPQLSVPSLSLTTSSVTPSSSLLTSVQDTKYPALTVLQSMHCTNCGNCKKKFKYTIEYLFHFVFQKSCQRALVNGKCEKSLFYQKISQAISAKVKVPQQKLVCVKNVGVQKTCGFQSKNVLQYCMHNDKHVPDNNEIFPCYFCAGIYFSPFSFYRHKCLVQLKNIQGKKSSTQNSLFSIYSAISLETQAKILTCPACSKRYEYISGLLNHLKKTNSKCLNILTKCYTKYITKDKYFDVAEMISSETQVELTPLACEVCLEEVANQVSYCMHKDHHEVGGDSKFVCKECSTQFNSPCSFYRHSCRSPNMNWCALCEKVEPSSGFRKKVEEIVIDDEVVKVKEERKDEDYEMNSSFSTDLQLGCNTGEENMSIPRIVSTSGSVEFSPVKETQLEFSPLKETQVELSPSGSESSIETPKSCTDSDAVMETTELLLAETILSDQSHDNQKKRKQSTDEGNNIPKKRCNLKKRGISKEFDENFIETKPIILDKAKESSNTEKTADKDVNNMCKVQEESPVESKLNKSSVSPEIKKEIDESKYEFDYWDCYICTDCSPLKMLGGADGLVNHCREVDGHTDIRPLWTFNQNEVKVTDLKKSYKYGVLVREKEREYLEYTHFKQSLQSVYKSTGLLYSTFHQQDMLDDESQNSEVPKLKLKIGKGANGKFSVLS